MAGTTVAGRVQSHYDSAEHKLRLQHNKLVDDVDAVVAKVNAIILAAATNIGAVAALDDAAAATSAKVADQHGNTTK